MVGGGLAAWVHRNKNKLSLRKIYFPVIEKYVKDVKQGQQIDLDLVESIVRPTRLAKEELQMTLMRTIQFRRRIERFRVCTF